MLRKNCRHLIAGDGEVVPCDRVRPEKYVQHLIKAALVADHAQSPNVAIEFILGVANASFFRGYIGTLVFA